ncbi:GntR family transcriptional regulator [Aquipuribacter sp. SD81]|uniref:GntR family transcriptional regulator n=1 Tax=Aquipuribacter sp. SD81 TaxID=3127703 RepID=UPI003016745B
MSDDGPQLVVDDRDPVPPYEQLRRQLATAILDGTLPDGRRLPPIRQIARDLRLASGTVARTYRELESAGLVVTSRGGGTKVQAPRVAPDERRQLAAERAEALRGAAARYLHECRLLGADETEAARAVLDVAGAARPSGTALDRTGQGPYTS